MQISKQELRQIIKEEIDTAIEEGRWDQFKARASGLARGFGAAGKSVGARASAIKRGALGQGGEVAAAGKAGAVKGKYAYGKKVKIIDLHKKKIEQMLLKWKPMLDARIEDMEEDLRVLGLEDSAGAQAIIKMLNTFSARAPLMQSKFSERMETLRQQVVHGETSQEE